MESLRTKRLGEERAIMPAAAVNRRSVEVPACGLEKPAIRLTTVGQCECVERGQRAGWRDFEDCAPARGPAELCCSVEVAVGGLNQSRDWIGTVSAVGFGAKAVKRGQIARRGDFEDRTSTSSPAKVSCAISQFSLNRRVLSESPWLQQPSWNLA